MPSEGRKMGELGFPNGQFVDSLDDVARGLAAGTISRGRAIKLGGAALLGSMGVLSLFPNRAGAQEVTTQAGLCRNKPAISNRRCPDPEEAHCGVCPECQCVRTVSGAKRCVNLELENCPATDECDSNRDCPGNELCVRLGGCCGGSRSNLCAAPCPTEESMCLPRG